MTPAPPCVVCRKPGEGRLGGSWVCKACYDRGRALKLPSTPRAPVTIGAVCGMCEARISIDPVTLGRAIKCRDCSKALAAAKLRRALDRPTTPVDSVAGLLALVGLASPV